MIKAVIFDVDGTLVDTVDMHAEAWQRALAEYGKEVEYSAVRQQIGKGGDQLMPVFLSAAELASLARRWKSVGTSSSKQSTCRRRRPSRRCAHFERIKRDGITVVLASSAKGEQLEHFKKVTDVADLLEGEASADDAEKSRPEPDIFLAAIREAGNPDPREALVIGDTPYDAIAATKANLATVGVLCGGFPVQSLTRAGCVAIYKDPADLLARYDESPIVRP